MIIGYGTAMPISYSLGAELVQLLVFRLFLFWLVAEPVLDIPEEAAVLGGQPRRTLYIEAHLLFHHLSNPTHPGESFQPTELSNFGICVLRGKFTYGTMYRYGKYMPISKISFSKILNENSF